MTCMRLLEPELYIAMDVIRLLRRLAAALVIRAHRLLQQRMERQTLEQGTGGWSSELVSVHPRTIASIMIFVIYISVKLFDATAGNW